MVDVRRFPTSRFQHFCQKELEALLANKGIRLVSMGD
ncbi:MAG: DUF488 domain-containing protein, partial [Dehalococcoidia bacterium]|nr:DUF488 domain-containing protein [Dehalococcoidia bacterium]